MMFSDLLNILKVLKFKRFLEAPAQGQKMLRGLDFTLVRTEMMSNVHSHTAPRWCHVQLCLETFINL